MSRAHTPRGLIERIVRGRVSSEDPAHAAGCTSCGPVLARAGAFDDELRRSARSLISEGLPAGILEATLAGPPALRVTARRPAPGFGTLLAATALLIAVTMLALGPGASPVPSPSPGAVPTRTPGATKAPFVDRFRTTDSIRGQLAKLAYRCNDGGPRSSPGSGPREVARDAAVCVAPVTIGPVEAVVIVGENAGGQVVEVAIKGDPVGGDTSENRLAFADVVAKGFAVALLDEGAGQTGAGWARVHVPQLEVGDEVDVVLRSMAFHAELGVKGWFVTVRPAL